MTVFKLYSWWWLNSHNKHYKFSSVCFSLPLGQINVIDNLGPCVTDYSGGNFPGDHHNSLLAHVGVWSVAPLHFLLIRMFSSSECQRCVTSQGWGWELGPTFTQVMPGPDREHRLRQGCHDKRLRVLGFELNVFHKYIFSLAGGYSALKISSAITAVGRQDWAAQADSLW